MIDFDLLIERQLYAATYGGPPPDARRLRAYLTGRGVIAPFDIVVVQLKNRPMKLPAALHIHPGLAYVCVKPRDTSKLQRRLRRTGLPFGQPQRCAGAASFVRELQRAILSLRAAQLAPVAKRFMAMPAVADELQAREAAVRFIRDSLGAPEALQRWLDIVLLRHQRALSSIRKRLIEGTMLATRDADSLSGIDHQIGLIVDEIQRTFSITDLARVFAARADDLRLRLVAGRERAAYSGGRVTSSVLKNAIEYLQANAPKPIGLRDAAKAVHVSPPHLSRLFRREAGHTLTDHLQMLRVRRAQELLTQSEAGLLTIAHDSGFATAEHFHRTFKRIVGVTPHAWRRMQRV